MEVSDAILKWCSICRMKPDPVEKTKIEKVLEAGRHAPSWGNTQPWRFIVVQDEARRKEIATAGGQPHIAVAPVIIVGCATTDDITRKGHGEALDSLKPAGAMTEELKNIILQNEVFAPYLRGEVVMTI